MTTPSVEWSLRLLYDSTQLAVAYRDACFGEAHVVLALHCQGVEVGAHLDRQVLTRRRLHPSHHLGRADRQDRDRAAEMPVWASTISTSIEPESSTITCRAYGCGRSGAPEFRRGDQRPELDNGWACGHRERTVVIGGERSTSLDSELASFLREHASDLRKRDMLLQHPDGGATRRRKEVGNRIAPSSRAWTSQHNALRAG